MRARTAALALSLTLCAASAHAGDPAPRDPSSELPRSFMTATAAELSAATPAEALAIATRIFGDPATRWCPPELATGSIPLAALAAELARAAHAAGRHEVAARCAAGALASTFYVHTSSYETEPPDDAHLADAIDARALTILADAITHLDAAALFALSDSALAPILDGERQDVPSPLAATDMACSTDNAIADPSPLFGVLHRALTRLSTKKNPSPRAALTRWTKAKKPSPSYTSWRDKLAASLRRRAFGSEPTRERADALRALGVLSEDDLRAFVDASIPTPLVGWKPIDARTYDAELDSAHDPDVTNLGGARFVVIETPDSLDEACLTSSVAMVRVRGGGQWRLDAIPIREDRDCSGRDSIHELSARRSANGIHMERYHTDTRPTPDCTDFEHVTSETVRHVCELTPKGPVCVSDPTWAFVDSEGTRLDRHTGPRDGYAPHVRAAHEILAGKTPAQVVDALPAARRAAHAAMGLDTK